MKKFLVLCLSLCCLFGCAKQEGVSLTRALNDAKVAVGKNNIPSMMTIEQDTIVELTGIDENLIESCTGEMAMINVQIDMILAFHAKSGKGEALEKALQDYQTLQENDAFQYPLNIAVIENAKIIRFEDDVYYLRFASYADEYMEASEQRQAELVQEVNQKAMTAITKLYE